LDAVLVLLGHAHCGVWLGAQLGLALAARGAARPGLRRTWRPSAF